MGIAQMSEVALKSFMGKPTIFEKLFKNSGQDFSAYYAALDFCRVHDISTGTMYHDKPVGLRKGEQYSIAKWNVLSSKERRELDGILVSRDFRKGHVSMLFSQDIRYVCEECQEQCDRLIDGMCRDCWYWWTLSLT